MLKLSKVPSNGFFAYIDNGEVKVFTNMKHRGGKHYCHRIHVKEGKMIIDDGETRLGFSDDTRVYYVV